MKEVEFNPLAPSSKYLLRSKGVRDLSSDLLDENGRLKIVPASFYEGTTIEERALFCVRNGVYNLPTSEQIECLRELIGSARAIEIGAGNGVVAQALGITATDNHMQDREDMRELTERMGQASVPYGPNVEKIDGEAAVRKYSPHTILACWLTHRYDPRHHSRGGNMFGPHEKKLLNGCKAFVFVGNTNAHKHHPLLAMAHKRIEAPWLYSRAIEGTNFIGVWKGRKL